MAYKGKYTVKNKKKYAGDPTKVTYRSLWERNAFRWAESNPQVRAWNSEEVVVPYKCKTDNKLHRYFVDMKFQNIPVKPQLSIKHSLVSDLVS